MDMRTDCQLFDTRHMRRYSAMAAAALRCFFAGCAASGVILCALLVTTFLVLPRPAHASGGQCIWEGGPGANTYPSCLNEDCLGAGGYLHCEEPQFRPRSSLNDAQVDGQMFDYGFDDDQELDEGHFCRGVGGTFHGLNVQPSCTGITSGYNGANDASTEDLAVQGAQAAMNDKFGGQYNPGTNGGGCGAAVLVSDTGWGQGTTYTNGQIVGDNRTLVYAPSDSSCNPNGGSSGGMAVNLSKGRLYICQNQYLTRVRSNGYLQCYIPSTGCIYCDLIQNLTDAVTIGNPVSPVSGGKVESKIDHQAGGAGGLSFGHFYNSQGHFSPPGSSSTYLLGFSDYWHFSYDRHLFVITGNSQLSAALHREDGTVEWFDGSGNEILNTGGAADRLASNGSGGWALTLANNDVDRYDANGNLTSYTTRSGIVTTITYDGNGRMSQIADSFGHTIGLAYNASGQLTTVTLPDGTSSLAYGYGPQGQLASITYADQTTLTYEYEDGTNVWLLTGITDESNLRYATYVYSAQGVVTHEEHAGGVDSYNFNIGAVSYNGGSAAAADALGVWRNYQFTPAKGVAKLVSAGPYCRSCPNTQDASYDANGNPQSVSDLNYNTTTYTYDQVRNLETSRTEGLTFYGQTTANTRTTTTQWHPTFRFPALVSVYAGGAATGTPLQTTSYTYDSYGNVLTKTLTDPATGASRTWTTTYYNSGLYGQVQSIDGPRTDVADITSYTYYNCTSGTQCGQVQTVTDALGHTTSYDAYDANGMPLHITDPNGTVTLLTYDLRQRIKTRTVGGEQTRYDYYPTGLLQKVTQPDGSYLSYVYDGAHRLIEVDDASGDRLIYTLDAMGNRIQQQLYDPSGALARTQSSVYNNLGLLWQQLTSTGSASQATVYGYDNSGNQTAIQAPLARNTSNVYDPLMRLQQVVDPAGNTTAFGYDALDHLVSVSDPRTLTTSYTYNGLGDLSKTVSPDTGTTQSTFDSGGNVSMHTDARGSTSTYTYDALNRATQVAYSDQAFNYTYDQGSNAIGRLSQITDGSGRTNYAYDALGRVVQKQQVVGGVTLTLGYTYQNSQLTAVTTPSGQSVSYAYDASGRIAGISVNGTQILGSVQYSPFGPISAWTWGNGTQTTRSFDLDGHLIQLQSAGTSAYTFYDDGSIASRSDDTEHDYSVVPGTATFAVSPMSNQLSGATGTLSQTYTYDPAGNLTGTGSVTYAYNGAGRLTGATQGITTVSFQVNALGQRVSKTSLAGTTLSAYDERGHLIGEYGTTGNLIEETVWLSDTPVATLRPNAAGSVDIYYVHTDHLNSPRRITRSTDNTIVWRWSSDPFSNGFVDQDPDGDGQGFVYNLRFPGQYYDVETGLSYNYQRDAYDSQTGRYLQSDPIGLAGGSYSTYAYANANPANNIDPSGLAPPGRTGTPTFPTLIPPNIAIPGSPENQSWANLAYQQISDAVKSVVNACKPQEPCPPCKTVSGKEVPVGTIAYRPLDTPPPGKTEHGIAGSHYNIYKANQAPRNSPQPCKCFWQPLGAVTPAALPPGAIPIEPFAD